LFRRHVSNIYRALDKPVPEELLVTNITTSRPLTSEIQPPTGLVHPVIDGELSNYFEWLGAGCVEPLSTGDAMHQSTPHPVSRIEFGFDLEDLYLNVSGSTAMRGILASGQDLSLNFLSPAGVRVVVSLDGKASRVSMAQRTDGGHVMRACPDSEAAVGRCIEIRVPFRCLGLSTHARVSFIVALNRNGGEAEHHPRHQAIEFEVPNEAFAARNWTA